MSNKAEMDISTAFMRNIVKPFANAIGNCNNNMNKEDELRFVQMFIKNISEFIRKHNLDINTTDKEGRTILHFFWKRSDGNIFQKKFFCILIGLGLNREIQDNAGHTANDYIEDQELWEKTYGKYDEKYENSAKEEETRLAMIMNKMLDCFLNGGKAIVE